jgi:hypothetical protein
MSQPPMFCPYCRQLVWAKRQRRGSIIVLLFLCCLGLLPGLLYAAACGGYYLVCPVCGVQLGVEAG